MLFRSKTGKWNFAAKYEFKTRIRLKNKSVNQVPLICAVFYLICHVTFGKTVMKLNLGMAYAIWCGVGIVVTTLISAVVFREKVSTLGIFGIVCIMIGCVILNMNGTGR